MSEYEQLERQFGQTVRQHRKSIHMSQQRLAAAMSGLGFDMHQTTFAKIERAARPILLTEALALSDLLMIHPDLWPKPTAFSPQPWTIPSYTVQQQQPQQQPGWTIRDIELAFLTGRRPPT